MIKTSEKLKKKFDLKGAPYRRAPHVAIYGIDKEVQKDQLLGAVYNRNKEVFQGMPTEKLRENFQPKFSKIIKGYNTWIVQVDPTIFRRIMSKGRLYVGTWLCKVEEYIEPMRCAKCLEFGHRADRCRNNITCGNCGQEGHHLTRCRSRHIGCANCKKAGYRWADHPTISQRCGSLELARRSLQKNTKYD